MNSLMDVTGVSVATMVSFHFILALNNQFLYFGTRLKCFISELQNFSGHVLRTATEIKSVNMFLTAK